MAKPSETASPTDNQGTPRKRTNGNRAKPRTPRGGSTALAKAVKEANRILSGLADRLAQPGESEAPIREFAQELMIQSAVKEQVLYPALREAGVPEAEIDEARVRNDIAGFMVRDLLESRTEDPFHTAKAGVLAQMVKHQLASEEKPRDGLLARAAAGGNADVVARIKERREALEAQGKTGALEPVPAVTFHRQSGSTRRPGEESTMPQYGPERDEHGRFMSREDEGRQGRRGSQGSSHSGSHGGSHGGGYGRMEEDDRGRGYESQRGRSHDDDDDRRGGRSMRGGGNDQGQGGWFGDRQGHSQASRMGWDERRLEGSDHDSGWHGDPEGHSEASRRGWETRRREGTDHDSGWHGDPQGHSEASRRGWETRRREGTEHESGWHGDPEGHSQASRMGWDERRREGRDHFSDDRGRGGYGSSSGGGRGQEGGYGGGRGSSGRGDDDRGRMQSRGGQGGGSQGGGDHDRGQGGWFGDSQGHSDASRRGWENRRDDDDDRGGRRR